MSAQWKEIAVLLEPGGTVMLRKESAQHPRDGGLLPGIDLPVGQLATFKLPVTATRSLRVREYPSYYVAELVDCASSPPAEVDPAGAGVAIGAVFGLLIGKSFAATCVGALIGGALGATLERLDETSETAPSRATNGHARTGLAAVPPRATKAVKR